ncbi:MAG: hypothetical protein J1D88_02395 [Treponema sp.]|nr:hypothetical protein [Treponema sp.]
MNFMKIQLKGVKTAPHPMPEVFGLGDASAAKSAYAPVRPYLQQGFKPAASFAERYILYSA